MAQPILNPVRLSARKTAERRHALVAEALARSEAAETAKAIAGGVRAFRDKHDSAQAKCANAHARRRADRRKHSIGNGGREFPRIYGLAHLLAGAAHRDRGTADGSGVVPTGSLEVTSVSDRRESDIGDGLTAQ
jgi:hypothetical protein